MTIIAICGPAGSGKTALAKVIAARGFTRLKFAGGIKAMLAGLYRYIGLSGPEIHARIEGSSKELKDQVFGRFIADTANGGGGEWPSAMADGLLEYLGSRYRYPINGHMMQLRRELVTWLAKDVKSTSPRHLMQTLGTELGRHRISNDFWIDMIMEAVHMHDDVVIDDMRFDNEASAIVDAGGWIVARTMEGENQYEAHLSEGGVSSSYFNYVVPGRDSVGGLGKDVTFILRDIGKKEGVL